MRRNIVRLGLCFLVFLSMASTIKATGRSQDQEARVDQVLNREIDVTGDGVKDLITLHLKGLGWQAPFNWELSIRSKGKLIFSHESDDSWLDKFFNDPGYVDDQCKSYLACKMKYYLHDLLDHLFIATDLSPNDHAYDKTDSGSIHFVARQELENRFKLPASEAEETVNWMIQKLKSGKTWVLYVPISPVLSEYPRMYVEKVAAFITIYEW